MPSSILGETTLVPNLTSITAALDYLHLHVKLYQEVLGFISLFPYAAYVTKGSGDAADPPTQGVPSPVHQATWVNDGLAWE